MAILMGGYLTTADLVIRPSYGEVLLADDAHLHMAKKARCAWKSFKSFQIFH